MKCLNCDIEFKSQRATAQFHNTACRVAYSRKKKVESLPGYINDPTKIPEKINEVKSKVAKRLGSEIPDEELNQWYRGKEGKLRLAIDLAYASFFSVPKIILTEKERLEIVEKRKDSDPNKKFHLEVSKPTEKINNTRMAYGGVTRDHRVHFMTPTGPVSFPLNS